MKTKIIALFASLVMVFMLFGATPANAASTSCVAGNYGYVSTVNWTIGASAVFKSWSITGPLAMEYRVRWIAPAGNAFYDTGYVAWQPTNPSGTPNVSRYFNKPSTILVNAGLYGDGVATCEMRYTVPAQ